MFQELVVRRWSFSGSLDSLHHLLILLTRMAMNVMQTSVRRKREVDNVSLDGEKNSFALAF